MSKTVNETFEQYYDRFFPSIKAMSPSEAVDSLLVNAKRSAEMVESLGKQSGDFSSVDYNSAVLWIVIVDAVKAAVEDAHGPLSALKDAYPDKFYEIGQYMNVMMSDMNTIDQFSTEAGDLVLQQEYKNRADNIKTATGMDDTDLAAVSTGNLESLDSSEYSKLYALVHGPVTPLYFVNDLDAPEGYASFFEWLRANMPEPVQTEGTQKAGIPILPVALGIGAAFLAFRG